MKEIILIKVLLTAIGCPGGISLIQSLRKDPSIKIVGTDMRADIPARFLLEKFYVVSPGQDEAYIEEMLKIVVKEKIDVLLPLATFELDALSYNKKRFKDVGCEVCISEIEGQRIANNRHLMSERFRGESFIPDFEAPANWKDMRRKMKKLGFPDKKIIVKPFVSHGSIGLKVVDNKLDLYDQYRNEKPYSIVVNYQTLEQIFKKRKFDDILLQEYLPGQEWEVDLLLDPITHKVICGSLRKESEVVLSAAQKVVFTKHPKKVLDIGKHIAEKLQLSYVINLSIKLDESGRPKATEINPRLGAGMFLPISAGLNYPLLAVYLALGIKVDLPKLKEGLVSYIYRGFLILDDNKNIIDQTLGGFNDKRIK